MIDALPSSAKAKLTAIRQAAEDANALNSAGVRSINLQREREVHLRNSLARLESGGDANAGLFAETQRELNAVTAEIERIEAIIGQRQRRLRVTGDIMRKLERWLQKHAGSHFAPVVVEAAPRDGETLEAALDRTRDEIDDLAAERRKIETAPLTPKELKEIVRERIDAMAAKGQAKVYGVSTGQIRLDLLPSTIPGDTMGGMFNREVVENMMAWLHRDALIARLEAEIDATAARGAVSSAEKVRARSELPARILALERAEEALVEQALAAGLNVARRLEASPAAVLGVEVVSAAEAKAA